MLDIKFLRQNWESVRRKMLERGQEMDFGPFVALDARRGGVAKRAQYGLPGSR
jgi:seryl-tRNA synthetase